MARKKTDTPLEWEPSTAPCPYPDDAEFLVLWKRLLSTPKWTKKKLSQIQFNVDRLLQFEVEYAKELVSQSIEGEWQGVVFTETKVNYEIWKQKKLRLINGTGNPEKNQQFRKDVNSEFASRNY